MAFLIMYILDNAGQMPQVLQAWQDVGAPGITILQSAGIERLRQAGFRDDLPLMPSLSDLLSDETIHHKTLLTVVKDHAMVDRIVEATRAIVGDFNQHHTGLVLVLPVAEVYGLERPARPGKPD